MPQNIVVLCRYGNRIHYLFNKTCELLHKYKGFKCHRGSAQIFAGELRIRFMLEDTRSLYELRHEKNIQFIGSFEWGKMLERKGQDR